MLKYVKALMNFENIMLSERSLTKDPIHCGCIYINDQNNQIYRDRKQLAIAQGHRSESSGWLWATKLVQDFLFS